MARPYEVPKLTRLVWYSLEELRALMGETDAAANRSHVHDSVPQREGLLTPRERDLIWLSAWGHSYRRIALILGISHHTVKNMMHVAFIKLGVDNKLAAITAAHQLGEINVKEVMRWHLE